MMNVYYLMPQGGRWSVIILSMTQAEQTSNLSPYCNEPMSRNSNYLFDRLTNDKNSCISADTRAGACSNTNICPRSHGSRWSQRSRSPLTPPSHHRGFSSWIRPHDGGSWQPITARSLHLSIMRCHVNS